MRPLEISSVEAPKEGKFEEAYSMDISFLQLPFHIFTNLFHNFFRKKYFVKIFLENMYITWMDIMYLKSKILGKVLWIWQ